MKSIPRCCGPFAVVVTALTLLPAAAKEAEDRVPQQGTIESNSGGLSRRVEGRHYYDCRRNETRRASET